MILPFASFCLICSVDLENNTMRYEQREWEERAKSLKKLTLLKWSMTKWQYQIIISDIVALNSLKNSGLQYLVRH